MPRVVLAGTFVELRRILKSAEFRPTSMAQQYRLIGEHLGQDFSPAIRLLELLPVFLSGSRHAAVRRLMATGLAAARGRQEQAAQRVIDSLPDVLARGRSAELMSDFVRPLWHALVEAHSGAGHAHFDLVNDITSLFDGKLRLRERLRINERIRQFIESDPDSAEQRLLALGQNVLGAGPFTGTMALSLHHVFSANLGRPFDQIGFPERFPVSALPVTDRIRLADAADAAGATDDADAVRRCVLHSKDFSTLENDEALYGIGEHACLGRPVSNSVWSMVTARLASLDRTILSSTLTLASGVPESEEDFLALSDPFVRPQLFQVRVGP